MNPRVVRVQHRARDVAAARAFYAVVLGDAELDIVPLPEHLVARGVPPHWLGVVGVDDVEQTVAGFAARGATQLGPVQKDVDGALAILRDAGGAVIALTSGTPASVRPAVGWFHLDAHDAAATFDDYRAVFGWKPTLPATLDSGETLMRFAWEAGGPSVGSYADLASRPGNHPQWVIQFRVASVDVAMAAVRGAGGVVLADVRTQDGARVAVCDDPDSGAFALRENA